MYVNVRAIIEREGPSGTEIVIQRRVKSHEDSTPYELPGGRLEEYEPIMGGLRREVYEETGLDITSVLGEETRMETNGTDSKVEVMKPFAVYQTIQGPVDSVGFYFRCNASGKILSEGDETEDIKWISVNELRTALENNEIDFSLVDKLGVMYYLKWKMDNRLWERKV